MIQLSEYLFTLSGDSDIWSTMRSITIYNATFIFNIRILVVSE